MSIDLTIEERQRLMALPIPERRGFTMAALQIDGIVTWDPGRVDWPMTPDAILDTTLQIRSLPEVTP